MTAIQGHTRYGIIIHILMPRQISHKTVNDEIYHCIIASSLIESQISSNITLNTQILFIISCKSCKKFMNFSSIFYGWFVTDIAKNWCWRVCYDHIWYLYIGKIFDRTYIEKWNKATCQLHAFTSKRYSFGSRENHSYTCLFNLMSEEWYDRMKGEMMKMMRAPRKKPRGKIWLNVYNFQSLTNHVLFKEFKMSPPQ